MNLFELAVKISADSGSFEKAISKAQKQAKTAENTMSKLSTAVSKADATVKKFSRPVNDASESMEDLGDEAKSSESILSKFASKINDASQKVSAHKNKIEILKNNYKDAKTRVEQLTREFNVAAKSTGILSDETKNLAEKLKDAEKEMEDAKGELSGITDGGKKFSVSFSTVGAIINTTVDIIKKVINIALIPLKIALDATFISVATFTTALTALNVKSIELFSTFEQLAGGAEKIFDQMDQAKILQDARNAYVELGISANSYLAVLNDIGAAFASTMGDEKGYETARKGLIAISDYASGTGKSVDELSSKFTMITRATSSYQSIADQFSGILPATSKDFLDQAQSVGVLSDKYKSLTDVPIAEYQEAVSEMLERGVQQLGLAGNTAAEAASTISGSFAATKASVEDLFVAFADPDANFEEALNKAFSSAENTVKLLLPRITKVLENVSPAIEKAIDFVVKKVPEMVSEYFPIISGLVTKIIQTFGDTIEKNSEEITNSIVELLEIATSDIDENSLIPTILSMVSKIFVVFADIIAESAPIIVESFNKLVTNIINSPDFDKNVDMFVKATGKIIEAIIYALIDSLGPINETAYKIIKSMYSSFTSDESIRKITSAVGVIIEKFIKSFVRQGKAMNETIKSMVSDMSRALFKHDWFSDGSAIIEKIRNGISNAWNGLKAWFNGLWDSFFGSKTIGSVRVGSWGVNVDGSHANGLDYVPYDGYIAQLHKGERVLTATEAKGYDGNSFGDIIINIDGARYRDEQNLAAAIAQEIQSMTDRRAAVYA